MMYERREWFDCQVLSANLIHQSNKSSQGFFSVSTRTLILICIAHDHLMVRVTDHVKT